MKTSVTRKATKSYYYYSCKKHHEQQDTCPNRKTYRADKLEADVWELVSELLQNPEQLRADLEEMIEQERESTQGTPPPRNQSMAGEAGRGGPHAQRIPGDGR
jgi:hypothetical protein